MESPLISAPELQNLGNSEKTASREFLITEGATETVVVYLDRAEISRAFKANVQKGENDIVLKGLSPCIDKDSIRVEGRGSATILEVSFQTKHLKPDEQTDAKTKQQKLTKELSDAIKKKELLELKQTRLKKQRTVLDGFANNAVKGAGINVSDNAAESSAIANASFLSKDNLVGMTAFLDLFDRHADKLDVSLHFLKTDIENCTELIGTIQKNLRELNVVKGSTEASELSILLEAHDTTEVTLCVSYVVSKAMWTPKYDIRVFGNEQQMKIQYYGVIQQATGEDWVEAKVCLSTATPSVGGVIPVLGTQKLHFKPKPPSRGAVMQHGSIPVTRRAGRRHLSLVAGDVPPLEMFSPCVGDAASVAGSSASGPCSEPAPAFDVLKPEVKDSITTTMYEIARRSTIPCDNVGHKVTVAIIDLQPTFEYQCVPKMSTNAFLKGRVKNTSPYALLAGPTNVFLDNNFIAKAELKAVSPNEEFTCSLGVDPTVKVDYKPLNKYREQGGIISKTTTMTYRQLIEVKNTHKDPIKILISDHLPLSTEERIKVTLQEPNIKHPEKYDLSKPIRLTPSHNVEWDLELQPGEIREIVLKYNVEHPSAEIVDTDVTRHASSTDV